MKQSEGGGNSLLSPSYLIHHKSTHTMKEIITLRILAKDFYNTRYDSLTDCPIARAYRRQVENKNKRYPTLFRLIEVRMPVLVIEARLPTKTKAASNDDAYDYFRIFKARDYANKYKEYEAKAKALPNMATSTAKICTIDVEIPLNPNKAKAIV